MGFGLHPQLSAGDKGKLAPVWANWPQPLLKLGEGPVGRCDFSGSGVLFCDFGKNMKDWADAHLPRRPGLVARPAPPW